MLNLKNVIRSTAAALAVGAAILFAPAHAYAGDATLKLKDGRTLVGEIVKQEEGYVWIKYKIGDLVKTEMFGPSEIDKLTKDEAVAKPAAADPSKPADGDKPADAAAAAGAAAASDEDAPKFVRRPGVPRAAVLTLGEGGDKDMVGEYMTAHALREAIPKLQAEGVDIVVFTINSGGGYGFEVPRISDVIHNEYKKKFRTVAWIKSAISAAAMSAHCMDEIYFMPEGNYGACTGWFGSLIAVKGRELEESLLLMESISARGNHDPKIMRSMQIMEPLSATIDNNGDVTWFQDETSGQEVVNRKGKILTFDAPTAQRFKFSKGTAANIDELGKAMGFTEVDWVGVKKPGKPYPVSKAEEMQIAFRNQVFEDSRKTRQYFTDLNADFAAANAEQDRQARGKFVNRCWESLNKIKRMCKNNPNFMLTVIGVEDERGFREWYEKIEYDLRRLMSGR